MHPVVQNIIDAVGEHLGGYEPENGLEWADFMASLPDLSTEVGDHLNTIGERLGDDYPDDPQVTEAWNSYAQKVRSSADEAEEAHQAFERAHEDELRRLREPRQNEEVWDVSKT